MKKLSATTLLLALACGALHSCREDIKTCAGKIKELNDTVMVASIGDYDIAFDIRKAECDNGAVMLDDSVTVHYIGDLKDRKARALLIHLMPQPSRVVDAVYDPSKKLEVSERALTDEELKAARQFVKDAKAARK